MSWNRLLLNGLVKFCFWCFYVGVFVSNERETKPTLFAVTVSGTRASGRPALCRTWSRTGRSRPCHTTSSCFTSNSKSPNNLQWDSCVDVRLCVRLTLCVCMCGSSKEANWRNLHPWRTISLSLRKRSRRVKHRSNVTESNKESILMIIWHFLLPAEATHRNKSTPEGGDRDDKTMMMNDGHV